MKHLAAVPALVLALAAPAAAQDRPAADSALADTVRLGGTRQTTLPIPIFFYSEETGTGGGLGVIHTRRPRADPAQRPTSASATVIFTRRGQKVVSAGGAHWTKGNRTHAFGNASFARFPTDFWGLGNDAPRAAQERYTPQSWAVGGGMERQVRPHLFVGGTASASDVDILDSEDGGIIDSGAVPGSEGGRLYTLGATVGWDTRAGIYDNLSGVYAKAYAQKMLGDFSAVQGGVDTRLYVPVGPGVLATQAVAQLTGEDAPFYGMPGLGGASLLRGYRQNRYRDRHLLVGQAEYRFPVVWRIGGAVFGGVGQVAHEVDGFRMREFKPSVGGGVRVAIDRVQRMNLRVDVAYGDGSQGFYITLGEAF